MSDFAPRLGFGALAPARTPVRRAGHFLSINAGMVAAISRLAGNSLLGRVFSGASLLLSAWLFAPAEFTRMAVFLSLLNLATPLLFLRYETVILSAGTTERLHMALRLAGVVLACTLGLAGVMVFAAAAATGTSLLWPILFMASLIGRGFARLGGQLAVREGDFTGVARSTMLLAFSQPLMLLLAVAFAAPGAVAMALTDVVGNVLSAAYILGRHRGCFLRALCARQEGASLRALASEWRALPLVNLPAGALGAAFTSLPVLLLVYVIHEDAAGHVAMAFRLMDVPVQFMAGIVTPITLNRYGRRGGAESLRPDARLIFWLALAAVCVFGGLSLAATLAEPVMIHMKWHFLMELVPAVALFQGGVALAMPLIEMAGLCKRQGPLLSLQLISVGALVAAAALLRDAQAVLLVFGLIAVGRALWLAAPLVGVGARAQWPIKAPTWAAVESANPLRS